MSLKTKIIVCVALLAAVIIAVIVLGITADIFSLRSVFGFTKVSVTVSQSSSTDVAKTYTFLTRADTLAELLDAKSRKLGFSVASDGSFNWNDEDANTSAVRKFTLRYMKQETGTGRQESLSLDALDEPLVDEREYVVLLLETNAIFGG